MAPPGHLHRAPRTWAGGMLSCLPFTVTRGDHRGENLLLQSKIINKPQFAPVGVGQRHAVNPATTGEVSKCSLLSPTREQTPPIINS